MKLYFQILLSTLLSLMLLATVASIITGAGAFFDGGGFGGMMFPYLVSLFGFVMFGIVGSIVWSVAFLLIAGAKGYSLKLHSISACFASLISVIVLSLIMSGLDITELIRSFVFLVFVVPVAFCSVVIHWVFFSKNT